VRPQNATTRLGSTIPTGDLLACGIAAAPLFLAVVLVQAATREGFDLTRHPISLLSLGDRGWIQIANFVVTGGLYLACAIGMRRVLHPGPGGRWGPWLVGVHGLGTSRRTPTGRLPGSGRRGRLGPRPPGPAG
jgi:hypothetical protein